MSNLNITGLYTYPIKSTYRIPMTSVEVTPTGFRHDRDLAVINNESTVLTARENEGLFTIKTEIQADRLTCSDGHNEVSLSLSDIGNISNQSLVTLFSDQVPATIIDHAINHWLSERLQEPCRLIYIDKQNRRKMKAKYNAQEGDIVGFQDAAPIHLITEASVAHLNDQLEKKVNVHHFRPNIIVNGTAPFAEDKWKYVTIGDCVFEVAVKTGRCAMLTINPESIERDADQQPLRTLALHRKMDNKVRFGIYLIPRTTGIIHQNDSLTIE